MMNNPYIKYNPCLYRGIVEDNIDPENLGRCKIRVPSVHGELTYPSDILPWARPIVLSPVSKGRGAVNLPDIGDIVWVFFEGANREFPIYFGGTYATGDLEINSDRVDLYSESDNRISYLRDDNAYEIIVKDQSIRVTEEEIELKSGEHTVTLNSGSLTVSGDMKVSGSLDIIGEVNEETSLVRKIRQSVTITEESTNELEIPINVILEENLDVYQNGLLLYPGTHYSISGSTLSLTYTADIGDIFYFIYTK